MAARLMGIDPAVARRLLQFELSLWCERAGVTHASLATRLGVRRAAVTQLITGTNLPSRATLEVMLDFLGAGQRIPLLCQVLSIARLGRRPKKVVVDHVGGTGRVVSDGGLAVGLEALSESIEVFDARVITPLLRTAAYAQCLDEFAGDIAHSADGLRERQDAAISDVQPVQLCWVAEERALRQVVIDRRTTADQVGHLAEIGQRSNVSVRLVPSGREAHPGLTGGFQVYRSGVWTVVCQETRTTAHYVTDAAAVADYEGAMEELKSAALDEDQSRGLLVEIALELRMSVTG